jgi:hypothetical protein
MIPKAQRILDYVNPLRVPTMYEKVNSKYPASKATKAALTTSEDSNALKLTDLARPDVVIAIGALKAIFANFGPQLDEDWMIPFRLKKVDSKAVLFIDSPLPKATNRSAFEKNQIFHKRSGKVFLLHPWTKSKVISKDNEDFDGDEAPRKKQQQQQDVDDVFAEGLDIDLTALETFGASSQVDGLFDFYDDKGPPKRLLQVDGGGDSDSDSDKLMVVEDDTSLEQTSDEGHSLPKRPRTRSSNTTSQKTPVATPKSTPPKKRVTRSATKSGDTNKAAATEPDMAVQPLSQSLQVEKPKDIVVSIFEKK